MGYGAADRVLHQVALGFAPVLELSFDIERARYGKAAAGLSCTAPVFVCGLARAGTTILMRTLHATGAFASLFVSRPAVPARAEQLGADERRLQALGRAARGRATATGCSTISTAPRRSRKYSGARWRDRAT
ncbi:MAG: hypothetical protein WDN44_10770 [Sphingomonas sp.]